MADIHGEKAEGRGSTLHSLAAHHPYMAQENHGRQSDRRRREEKIKRESLYMRTPSFRLRPPCQTTFASVSSPATSIHPRTSRSNTAITREAKPVPKFYKQSTVSCPPLFAKGITLSLSCPCLPSPSPLPLLPPGMTCPSFLSLVPTTMKFDFGKHGVVSALEQSLVPESQE
jgi:hypothetical protein